MENGFMECAQCASKPETPVLCKSCLHNRSLIIRLAAERMLREETKPIIESQGEAKTPSASGSVNLGECFSDWKFNTLADLISDGKIKRHTMTVLPNGMHFKSANPATQAKYFYHHEVESDGQKVTETIGFQTNSELISFLAAIEPDTERQHQLYNLIAPLTSAETQRTIICECGEATPFGPGDSYCVYCARLLPNRKPYVPSDTPTIRDAEE